MIPPTARRAARPLLPLAVLAGCAHYVPAPLRPAEIVLAAPDAGELARATAAGRPFLRATAVDLSAPLTLDALAAIAVVRNPDLAALRARSGVADAQAFAARLLPDPTFSGGFDKLISGPDALNGFAAQLGFDLNQLRLRRAARAASAATRQQVRLDLAWAEWQAAGQARLLGVRVAGLTAANDLAAASAASAAAAFATAQHAAGRGDIAGAELDARRQAALDAGDRARVAASALTAARGELGRLLGLPPPLPEVSVTVPPPWEPLPPPADLVATALARRLDLAALRSGYAAAEAATRLAVLQQFPALGLTLAGARDTAGNLTLGPQVALTLPLWNRNRGGIALATATRDQLKAEYEARLFGTRADIFAAVATIENAGRQRAALANALPELRNYAAATARAAVRGDLPRATGETAAQALRDRELALVTLDQTAAEATIALELLTGSLREGWTR